MLPCSSVSRIKLKRDSFKLGNKLEPTKRRWTGTKTVSGLNPLADRGIQVQDQASSPAPEAADVVSPERHANEICATADREPPSQFDGQASSKQDAHAEHDGCGGGYNQGTFPSTVSGFSNCQGGGTKAQSTCTRTQPPSKKTPKRLSEHRKEFFYRLRLALCLKRRNGGKRVIHGPTEVQCHALSFINSNVSVESDNISIKSTVYGEPVEQTPPAQLDPKYAQNTGCPDHLGQEKPRAGRGRPMKLFIDHFGGPDGRVKTTIKTDARRARARKARHAISGQTPNISSKLELRRQLRSDTRKNRKRLVKNSCCALCGDVKYTPPPSKNLAPLLSHRSRADRPSQTVCQKDDGHISESPTAMNFRFEKYPMVNLCDVARVFDIASRDFSCVLPAVLRQKRKCKRVQCLRKKCDFLVHPHLHGIKECRRKIANQSWDVSTPTHSCASFSSGDPPSGATGSTHVSDTAETPDGSAKEWDACLARNLDFESMRQTDVEGTELVLPGCDDNGPVLHFCEKDKACPMKNISESPTSQARRVPPLILRRVAVNGCKIVWDLNADGSSESCPTAEDVKTDSVKDGGTLTVKETDNCGVQPVQGMSISNSENATDCNNNQEMRQTNGITVTNTRESRLVMDTCSNGYEVTPKETSTLRTLNSNYCWFYFSEYNSCMRSVCWFPHVPRDGDEKFCIDTVKKFCHTGKHALILRAVEVFMGYYSSCSPSVSFSEEIVNSLLSSLLNFCLLREFEAVINLLLKHKRLPPPEIMLAVFKLVMERGLINSVPELIHLTSKVVEAGCVFSVDQCEVMQNHLQMMQVPRQQMDIFLAVKCRALVTNPHTSELSDLAQAVVRVEMLKHQEDWAGLALVFCNVCVGSHSQMELLRFCCCVTMALLKEPKGKLTLPYELFAESVCQQVLSNDMIKTILGRIGVSLIFRYHRTRDWNKGVKLVSVMFRLHIEFITLKGLMGNENRVSRCQLVTMATEFFLHSGSFEGALKMLRADGWFVSSSMWLCEQADIENRKHVLTLLAEKTSHRDAFEIITNLPGIRQPINGVQINDYAETFNAHLRLCLVKQTLPVAADILEFMLIHGMVPETLQLQNLIHKLGKQNNWSRARALFKRAQSAGFYAAVVCERDSLFLPCNLTEIEMTMAFEMFITFINTKLLAPSGASQPLLITLRRHADIEDVTESVYLAAGCRLLSAALIPNPKLSIRYTAVNKSQEQFFHLDRASAHKWFLQNERWAREIWAS
ncbi:uncharacterized protein topaz1 [Sinocyclocheilus grahami]|uniref:Protein TOPAZ1 n=1 Tax=Sinocyclocheilus grahami TaxID=75366 RepID=A0A672S9F4_SINGR|nr:PREDICTED: testis- and ovary-specific PAZ domain-containing protein 1 [Sinocyclocheilus grahami]